MKISHNKAAAKDLLRNDATCAFACMRSMDTLLGDHWFTWEPETLWLELSRSGVAVSPGNRDQIMAGRSIVTTARFYYDALVFEKTCLSFNNDVPHYEALDDAPPEYIAWTNEEAYKIHLFYTEENLEYDREPVEYTAVQLKRAGFLVAPSQLHWAQTRLDRYYKEQSKSETVSLKKDVMEAWAHGKTSGFGETPLDVQLARLAAVKAHFDAKSAQLAKDLAKLES